MTQHIKFFDTFDMGLSFSTLSLVAVLGFCVSVNVQAADPYNVGSQVSLITQPSARSEVKRELQALEEEYINLTIQALNRKQGGPDFSNEDVYISHLVDVIEGKTQQGQPNFADEEVYVDHLVEILLK